MNKSLLILLLTVSFAAFPQTNVDNLIFCRDGLVLQPFNSYGYSKSYNTAFNAGSINPAALINFISLTGGISYEFGNALPQSAGLIYPYGKWRLAAAFTQKYNVSTNMHGDWNLEDKSEKILQSYSLSCAYNLRTIFHLAQGLIIIISMAILSPYSDGIIMAQIPSAQRVQTGQRALCIMVILMENIIIV